MDTVELHDIPNLCKTKEFDLLRINHRFDLSHIQPLVGGLLDTHDLVPKDGYKTYDAIGLQYADPANPLYDAVQQTAFVGDKKAVQHRKIERYKEQNEIGRSFDFVYDTLAAHDLLLERGRILKAEPGHIHNDHLDYDIRIHLPVFTNPDCQMVYSGIHYHMPADGHIYLINGFRRHHFFNKGHTQRVHLVWLIQKELY